ncbi:hypothetical protein SAMN02745213_01008 [Succinivibrio dextrinosolvens DSM 3072]|uniref:Uncharacterized protein n=1 Tax=Succinivibrio dextrinosolvens DSM 3072 TaxID=1123324 RepID=A0A1T4V7T1_9GAMM|nr:hypothetical protein [Succinivibrio dextrinosolvens]SKA61045.1 hypothetical protein SAMN02745213_01008 [Succinivibrio dextrinosolvens DSM 3072]
MIIKSKLVLLSAILLGFSAYAETQMAYFPPVPESWNVKVEGTSIEYSSPVNKKTQPQPKTKVRFQYTKTTQDKDATTLAQEYAKTNECGAPREQGKAFFTISCPNIARNAVIVGEPNNMYFIELSGEVSAEAKNLINTYVTSIVNGKRTFEDREIGEKVSR